jgi:hypothetical protein
MVSGPRIYQPRSDQHRYPDAGGIERELSRRYECRVALAGWLVQPHRLGPKKDIRPAVEIDERRPPVDPGRLRCERVLDFLTCADCPDVSSPKVQCKSGRPALRLSRHRLRTPARARHLSQSSTGQDKHRVARDVPVRRQDRRRRTRRQAGSYRPGQLMTRPRRRVFSRVSASAPRANRGAIEMLCCTCHYTPPSGISSVSTGIICSTRSVDFLHKTH